MWMGENKEAIVMGPGRGSLILYIYMHVLSIASGNWQTRNARM